MPTHLLLLKRLLQHYLQLLSKVLASLLLSLQITLVWAHGELDDALPELTGVSVGVASAMTYLHTQSALPSNAMQGYLRQGDSGVDRRGWGLEHSVVSIAGRFTPRIGAYAAIGKHDSDPAHLEAAWVQSRFDLTNLNQWWFINAGRMQPAMGQTMDQAGHFDLFSTMPLAKRMAINDTWINDGVQFSWRNQGETSSITVDMGLWRSSQFPASSYPAVVPTLHLGWSNTAWRLDGFAAWVQAKDRASVISNSLGHTHQTPVCNAQLNGVVCFAGHSNIVAASTEWQAQKSALNIPITLSAAVWLRQESGQLESQNGLVSLTARNLGAWLQADWNINPQWKTAIRIEGIQAASTLTGAGATIVASDAGLNLYAPMYRQSVMLSKDLSTFGRLSVELGQERNTKSGQTVHHPFGLVRWVYTFKQ